MPLSITRWSPASSLVTGCNTVGSMLFVLAMTFSSRFLTSTIQVNPGTLPKATRPSAEMASVLGTRNPRSRSSAGRAINMPRRKVNSPILPVGCPLTRTSRRNVSSTAGSAASSASEFPAGTVGMSLPVFGDTSLSASLPVAGRGMVASAREATQTRPAHLIALFFGRRYNANLPFNGAFFILRRQSQYIIWQWQ